MHLCGRYLHVERLLDLGVWTEVQVSCMHVRVRACALEGGEKARAREERNRGRGRACEDEARWKHMHKHMRFCAGRRTHAQAPVCMHARTPCTCLHAQG